MGLKGLEGGFIFRRLEEGLKEASRGFERGLKPSALKGSFKEA